jgi:hypothetical protein
MPRLRFPGNRTTFIPADRAPLQPTNATPPMSTSLPPPPRASLIVEATDTNWTNIVKYTMPDNDVVEIDTTTHAINRYFSRVGTVNLALAVQPGSGNLFVANTDARNLVRFEPNVRGHIVTNRLSRINMTNNSITHFDLNPGVDYSVMPNLAAKTNALAQPTAIAFGPSGSFAFVAAFGSDRVARINPTDGTILSRIEIGSARGSVVDPRGKTRSAWTCARSRRNATALRAEPNFEHDLGAGHREQHRCSRNSGRQLRPDAGCDSPGPRLSLRHETFRERHRVVRVVPHRCRRWT